MGFAPGPGGAKLAKTFVGKAKPKIMPQTGTSVPGGRTATGALTGTKTVNVGGPGVTQQLDVKALQATLAKAGYKIPVDGQLGPTTKAALGDYLQVSKGHPISTALQAALGKTAITGNRDPARFNSLLNPSTKSIVSTVKVDKNGNDPGGTTAPPAGGGQQQGNGSIDFSSLGDPNTASVYSEALANDGSHAIDPSYANQIAGLQFDPQITDLANQIKGQPEQAAQNMHDIQHWYDLVKASQATAGTRDAAAGAAGVHSIQGANSSILSSLGGAANAAGATVGAAGAAGLGTLAANATTQDQYNNDIAPILQLEQSGALSHENARQSQLAASLAAQMASLKGQRGQAQGVAQTDLMKYNNDQSNNYFTRLMAIKDHNSAAAQQNYTNRRSVIEDQIAAMTNGIKAQAAQTIADARLAAATGGGAKAVNMAKIAQVASGLLGVDAQGRLPVGVTPAAAAQKIAAALISQGLTRGSSEYQTLGQQLYGTYKGNDGQPLQAQPTWFSGQG